MSTSWTGLLTGSSSPFLASDNIVAFVDVHDSTQSPSGSLVKGTIAQFFAQIPTPIAVKSSSATAFTVGLNGATNPALTVDASTALQVAGLKVTGAVTGGTVAVVVTDSGSNANLTVNAKGSGTIGIGSVSTGRVTITPVTTITGALTLSAALTYGGVTLSNAVTGTGNMVLSAGPTLTGTTAMASASVSGTLTVTGATITGLTAASVASGTFPGAYTVTGALTLSSALTYGGVTLSNAVTGTGNMVLSASPTFTGTITAATANWSGLATFSAGATVASGQTLTVTGATITGLTAASVGAGTFPSGAFVFQGAVSGITTLATSSTINSQTISATANFTGTVTVATGLTVSAGTTAVQALTATTGAFTGQITGTKSSASQAKFTGYASVPGTSSFAGQIELGVGGGANGSLVLQHDDSGQTTEYIDSTYDSATAAMKFRMRTSGSAVVALTLSAAGAGIFGGQVTSGAGVFAANASSIGWASRSVFSSSADGIITVSNNAISDFTRLTFGGTTASFPALKRSSATLAVRLADDSADANLTCAAATVSSIKTQSVSLGSVANTGVVAIKDFAGLTGTWLVTVYSTDGVGQASELVLATVGFDGFSASYGASKIAGTMSYAFVGSELRLTNSSGASSTMTANIVKVG